MTRRLDSSKRYKVEPRAGGMLALVEDGSASTPTPTPTPKPKPKPTDDPGRLRAALDRLRGYTPTPSPPTSSPPIRVDLIPPASLAVTASQRAEADWRRTVTREQLRAHHEAEQARIAPRPGLCRWCGVATDVHGETGLCGDCHRAHDPTDPGTSLARRLAACRPDSDYAQWLLASAASYPGGNAMTPTGYYDWRRAIDALAFERLRPEFQVVPAETPFDWVRKSIPDPPPPRETPTSPGYTAFCLVCGATPDPAADRIRLSPRVTGGHCQDCRQALDHHTEPVAVGLRLGQAGRGDLTDRWEQEAQADRDASVYSSPRFVAAMKRSTWADHADRSRRRRVEPDPPAGPFSWLDPPAES